MASASSSSAKNLFSDSKKRLEERIALNINNASSVARQIVRGSKSNEIIMQSAKAFAQQESTMDNSLQNLKKMELIYQHMNYQYEAIQQSAEKLEYVKEQVNAMER
uniref:BLOC-1-related complex subunit 7 n=1 Tax=Corethrella appendiculata TaxID=1370023 RepID=U5EJS5_9DIPT